MTGPPPRSCMMAGLRVTAAHVALLETVVPGLFPRPPLLSTVIRLARKDSHVR
jgi:hypothetical protein